ncbi:hypothetical protein P153DRAFT_381562 [Dothidotthia symphoricarpi CBS 119687]|uniref:Uncharacterized protein n=1 Tax=Dothidotthia symphoricarpi CBS 119687 TaxID=1392245 RepID=A0A6A6AMG2_9PLEO|nr:uncharacterized protein P153DRAFT_381562 [Dothidotthia symphoricarpi CBS 119687]KAF2133119.1 hypothetical protein P153DRAFT_381562 [Dothidotthia symphoricarpi CBS 119687]
MIVRDSPKSGVSSNQPNWPPKSPHEALLCSPSGRRKYERQHERTSVSPSPSKRRPMSRGQPQDDGDDTEEEDEETLQLKLQAIEARLKLKKLQNARKTAETGDNASSARPSTAGGMHRRQLSRPTADLQVPASPVRIRRAPEEQRSPARVMLGIDKGLRAQDVSLKRAGSAMSHRRDGGARPAEVPRIKSFSERMADSRNREKQREENETKLEKRRSRGFGLQNIEGLRDRPISRSNSSFSSDTRSSQDMPPPASRAPVRGHTRTRSDIQDPPTPRPGTSLSFRTESSRPPPSPIRPYSQSFTATSTTSKYAEVSQRDNSTEASSFESLSGLHLKSRQMQHNVITRTLEGKTVLTIPQLLKTVKAPDYEPPEWENDYVVLGVVCSKSSPLNAKNAARDQSTSNQERGTDQQGKFMVIRLTDLKWELDLYLFDTGFSQFWKLTEGTLIAILNPDIMPPRNRDTGKFSLKLTSSDDTVLEIGAARDLDFCHAKRKDGKDCGQWIDGRKTEVCEFHVQLQVEKSKRGRMEINTMTGMGRGPAGGGKHGMFGGGRGGGSKGDELRREGKFHDREIHETVYIAPRPGGAARLLDGDNQSWERGASREEKFRKQLAEKEKERELAKRLGTMGQGSTGGDYMKLKGADIQNLPVRGVASSRDASAANQDKQSNTDFLGLLGRKADDVSLAPVHKRKRTLSSKSTASSAPIGWSGASKHSVLLSPKKMPPPRPALVRQESTPTKKRARLLLPEKGIREPGRDSLGGLDVGLIAAMDEDDDDDLEVV